MTTVNGFAQALAFICWTDDFTRTTTFGLGSDYTWESWDSSFAAAADSTYHVDGSKLINPGSFDYDSYLINRTIPDNGLIQFDFTTNSSLSDFPFIVIVWGNNGFEAGKFSVGFFSSLTNLGTTYYLTGTWNDSTFTGADIPVTIAPSKTYRIKAIYSNSTGKLNAKIWDTSGAEPAYMLFGDIPSFVPSTNAWLDLYFGTDVTSFDNLVICSGDLPIEIFKNSAQATAQITNTTPNAQTAAQITNTTPNAQAAAYINLETATSPFYDPFTRTTVHGLGTPYYVWDSANSQYANSFQAPGYVNGTQLIIPPNITDSYYIGYNFAGTISNRLSIDINIASLSENFDISFYVPGTDILRFRIYVVGGIFATSQYVNGVQHGGTSGFSINTNYTFEWSWFPVAASGSFRVYINGVFQSSGGFIAGNTNGSNVRFTFTGQTTQNITLDNLIIDSSSKAYAQAQAKISTTRKYAQAKAKIKAFAVKGYAQAQAYIGHFKFANAQADILQSYQVYAQAQAQIHIAGGVETFQAYAQSITSILAIEQGFAQALARIGAFWEFAQALARIGPFWEFAQAQAYMVKFRWNQTGYVQARVKIPQWKWAQSQAFIKPTVGLGQALSNVITYYTEPAQAQAYIVIDMRFGQAQGTIKQTYTAFAQAQTQIGNWKFAQTQARINTKLGLGFGCALAQMHRPSPYSAQAQARIVGYIVQTAQSMAQIQGSVVKIGQSQAFIKRTIGYGQALAFILRTDAGNLVRYNGYYLPGYLQEEVLESSMRINITGSIYGETYSEYIGLDNKILSLKMKVLQSNYQASKEKVILAGSMVRSNRNEFVQLTVIDSTKYYLAKTKSITLQQQASAAENTADYEVQFEVKPWRYGDNHSLIGTTLLDTNDVNRRIGNGTWTPVTIITTGSDITISGYTEFSEFTGFVSISGAVNSIEIDTENYIAQMNGQDRNDLMNIDYRLLVGPGRTFFAVSGASSIEIIYQDRWPL